MIAQIDSWIDQLNTHHREQRRPCSSLVNHLSGYFPSHFLATSYFVVVDVVPKPNFSELRKMPGLDQFLDMKDDAITYKDTYYIARSCESNMPLHVHELVHVAQWRQLGERQFVQRYIDELGTYGYKDAPLEVMAYYLQGCFEKRQPVEVLQYLAVHL
ncbi:hypothetical protein KFE80_12060 [bacterium SCSIO 12696]|nr:hypothetical protein KFE80_12060 [bacterium SCSIO 12696]